MTTKFALLGTLLTEAAKKQEKTADDICKDENKISSLAAKCVKTLKADNKDVGSMSMAAVTQQVRSCIDACMIDDGVSLSKDGLEKVVKCVLDEIKSKHKKDLFESEEEIEEAYKPTGKPRGRPRKNAEEKKPDAKHDEDDDNKKVSTKALAKSLEKDADDDEDDDVKRADDASKDGAKKVVDRSVKSDELKAAHAGLPAKMQQALDMLDVKSAMAARNEMRKMFPKITDEQLKHAATIWRSENE